MRVAVRSCGLSPGVPEAVPILAYHSLDETRSVISTPPNVFRRQMTELRERGFQAVGLSALLDAWDGRGRIEGRPLVLTFDDGLCSVAERAAPILRELRFNATLFVVAERCGQTNDWPGQPETIPRQSLLSLAELRGLADDGFEIGSHGLTHAALDRLPWERLDKELRESRQALEQGLGREVPLFAYPYGRASRAVREAVARVYRAACGTVLRPAVPDDDRHWLPRIDTYYLKQPSLFRQLGTPRGDAYLRLRALGRRLRRRSA